MLMPSATASAHLSGRRRRFTALSLILAAAALVALCLPEATFPSLTTTPSSGGGNAGAASRLLFADDSSTSARPSAITAPRILGAKDEATEGGATNYALNPDAFVDTIVSCAGEANCRFMFHHVYKTGGTSIENMFFDNFPPSDESMRNTCCGKELLGKLYADESLLAVNCRGKFSSYQIQGGNFPRLVQRCHEINSQASGSHTPPRTVVLSSYRDPVQLASSLIHQICNKYHSIRSDETKRACETCQYEADAPYWDGFVDLINDQFKGIWDVTTGLARSAADGTDQVQVLSIDMLDINSLFDRLSQNGFKIRSKRSNPEDKSTCSFSMPTEMMKGLKPSYEMYRMLPASTLKGLGLEVEKIVGRGLKTGNTMKDDEYVGINDGFWNK